MISKAIFLTIVFSLAGQPDEFYKERVREDITITQCNTQMQQVLPRIWNVYEGYKIKSMGCVTDTQLREILNRRP